jgi:acetylornithine/succinyldiaminopimelate/putrescine aminotransferase
MASIFDVFSATQSDKEMQTQEVKKATVSNRQLFLNYVAQTSDNPLLLEIVAAEGLMLRGIDGQQYYDLISGIGVSNIGHRHPAVLKAVKKQLKKYMHLMVYGEFVQAPQAKLAAKLTSTLPHQLDNVYFVNSGSEAIEGAMKLVKRYTARTEIIAFQKAYHGATQGALSIGGDEFFKTAYRPLLPDVRLIRYNETADLEQITSKTAAVFIETVQGEAGVRIPDSAYMQRLAAKCKKEGALLVADEIQAGFGRTGKFWAFDHFGITPDVVVCAKGMGGGMPIGAFIASQEVMSVLKNNPFLGHITTFGGHPVCCAAALATLKVIEKEKLYEKAEHKAELFKQFLVHPKIKEIRNCGLLMAVEFESYDILKPIIDKAISYGVLTDWFLHCNNSMRIAPPLTITKSQISDICGILLKAINEA